MCAKGDSKIDNVYVPVPGLSCVQIHVVLIGWQDHGIIRGQVVVEPHFNSGPVGIKSLLAMIAGAFSSFFHIQDIDPDTVAIFHNADPLVAQSHDNRVAIFFNNDYFICPQGDSCFIGILHHHYLTNDVGSFPTIFFRAFADGFINCLIDCLILRKLIIFLDLSRGFGCFRGLWCLSSRGRFGCFSGYAIFVWYRFLGDKWHDQGEGH